jgi:hypothetical protein
VSCLWCFFISFLITNENISPRDKLETIKWIKLKLKKEPVLKNRLIDIYLHLSYFLLICLF